MKKFALLTNYYEVPQLSQKYIHTFQFISDFFEERGIEFSQVSMKEYDYDRKCFRESLFHKDQRILQRIGDYIPDILWNRVSSGGSYIGEDTSFQTFPHRQIIDLSANKYLMYLYFSDYIPYTALLSDFFAYQEVQSRFGEKVVLKVINASNSSGVFFLKKEDLANHPERYDGLGYSYIVQDLVELHKEDGHTYEFRFVIVDGRVSYCLKRILNSRNTTELSSGWNQEITPIANIPEDLYILVREILKKRDIGTENVFTLDFGLNSQTQEWFLIEMNDFPGLAFEKDQETTLARYLHDVAKLIEKSYICNQLFHV